MKCQKCGMENSEGSTFCGFCGSTFSMENAGAAVYQNMNQNGMRLKKEKTVNLLIPIGLVIIAILAVVAVVVIVPFVKLNKAQEAFDAGRYEEAVNLFQQLKDNNLVGEKAATAYDKAKYAVAQQAVDTGDFDKAIAIYLEYDDAENVKKTREEAAEKAYQAGDYQYSAQMFEDLGEEVRAKEIRYDYAEKKLAEKQYKEAITVYEKYEDQSKVKDCQLAWAEYSVAERDYDTAIELYTLLKNDDKVRWVTLEKAKSLISQGSTRDIPKLLEGYTGEDVVALYFSAFKKQSEGQAEDKTAEIAREFGRYLRDVNSQLQYCNLLKKAELDMWKVYPDGVEVDVDLNAYQFYHQSSYSYVTYGKNLVFSRYDDQPVLQMSEAANKTELNKAIDAIDKERESATFSYHVKLEPALMTVFPDSKLASSWEACDTLIILEKGYIPDGFITVSNYSPTDFLNNNPLSYEIYPHYMCYNGVFAYSRKTSTFVEIIYADANYALASQGVIGNSYDDAGIDLESLDLKAIIEALEDEESEASKEYLSQFDEKVLELLKNDDNGQYILLPDTDAEGNVKNFKGTTRNTNEWFIPKYMIADEPEDNLRDIWKDIADSM